MNLTVLRFRFWCRVWQFVDWRRLKALSDVQARPKKSASVIPFQRKAH